MFGFWESLYAGLLMFGGGFLLVQLFLGQLGDADIDGDVDAELEVVDGDLDLEVDGDLDADGAESHALQHGGAQAYSDLPSVSFVTPLVIAPTLAGIGFTGLMLTLVLNLGVVLHLPLAIVSGIALGYAVFFLLAKVIAPMQGSTEVRVGELWGTVAEVTTPIPAGRLGEIRFVARGAYQSTPARSVTGEALPRGQMVMIEKIENAVALVRPTR